MRILLLSHGASPFGAERVLLALAAGLAGRGHEAIVDFPHDGPALRMAGELPGVDVQVTPRRRLPRCVSEGVGFFLTAPAAVAGVRRSVRRAAPDVVWVNSMYNPWAAVAARLAGAPVVWHLHEATLPEPLGTPVATLIGWAATRVVAVSEFTAAGFRQYPWLRDRLVVARNPLLRELRPVEPDDDDRPFTVGYLGQLEPRKRVPDLVAAVARVPGVRARIAGDGKARSQVETAVRETGVEDRVEFLGYRDDIAALLASFDCLAIPSLREPFGLVAVEAMAAGVPVVAARSGALQEVLGDAALYHRPRDAAGLAGKIRKLKADRTLQGDLTELGLRRAEEFREGPWLDRVEQIAHQAVRESRYTS